jgi:ATP-dependent DNA ligase
MRMSKPAFLNPEDSPILSPADWEEWLPKNRSSGFRAQLIMSELGVRVFTQDGLDWTDSCSPIAEAALELPCRAALIDGEIIVEDEPDRADDYDSSSAATPHGTMFNAFDLLYLDGVDMRGLPLQKRREALQSLIGEDEPTVAIQFGERYALAPGHAW